MHLFTLEVAEIRKPQAYMQAIMESNNQQLQVIADQAKYARVDLDVVKEKVGKLEMRTG